MFSIEPEGGVHKPQMAILLKHLTPAPTSLPPPTAEDLHAVQEAHFGIVRVALPLDQATTVANAINAGNADRSPIYQIVFSLR